MRVGDGPRRPWLAGAIATVGSIGVLVSALLHGRGNHGVPHVLGTAALILSAVFIFSPFYLLKRHGGVQAGSKYFDTTAVVDRGVYGVVRHPQYLGYMLLVSGFALRSQSFWTVMLALCANVFFYVQARKEEGFCVQSLGNAYEDYLKRVPRFNFVSGFLRHWRQARGR
ncbi:MAG: isoprenylcysteine carboxylmethyltransferase family protein [Gemmatimonadota bacterium]|nr:MAG: isoprenylcysteine carboxylmethyltransferase family protein [Gemmatimonadota bacterium]